MASSATGRSDSVAGSVDRSVAFVVLPNIEPIPINARVTKKALSHS